MGESRTIDAGSGQLSIQERLFPTLRCFGCGPANPKGLRLRSFPAEGWVVARFAPWPEHDNGLGYLNGGIIATVLDYKLRIVDTEEFIRGIHESIEFELPSVLSVMHVVVDYLLKRVDKVGVVKTDESNLFVALDEAFVNAIKHGNKFDADKQVFVSVVPTHKDLTITVRDQGNGFNLYKVFSENKR